MAGFYTARSRTIPPLPWPSFAPPFSSPFTANVLITSRIMGLEAGPMVRSGNLRLTGLALLTVGLFCATATFVSLQG
jgi:hypothetical protein